MDYPANLIISGIKSTSLSDEEKDFIKNEKLGGVILFAYNFESPAQIAELVNSIQSLRDEWPLFISVDHEGGRVMRFRSGFSQFPAMYDLAQLDSPKITFEVHSHMGRELAACGINLSFSPVCDIWTNEDNKVIGDRSFGHDVETVEKHVSAAIRGLQTQNVLSCAKHFPGHGNTLKDSHFDLPIIKETVEQLRSREIQPFIKASKSRTEFMMMAHLIVDAIDDKLITTVSPRAYQFLRDETKFTKIIITDDMEMKAIADRYSIEEAAVLALDAGTDMLLYRFPEDAIKATQAIREALKTKRLKKDKYVQKINRVDDCKKEHFKEYHPIYVPKITSAFNSPEAKKIIDVILEKKNKALR